MSFFRVKNFEKFQHYRDRSPPWIKLYNELLDDYDFGLLPDASKMHLIAIWLLASRSGNKLPFDAAWVSRRINATEAVNLTLLVDCGFILTDQELHNAEHIASKPLAKCLSREREETERENIEKEREREKARAREATLLPSDDWPPDYETRFWKFWPNLVGKPAAMKALAAARKRHCSFVAIMTGIADYIRDRPPDRPWLNPATFLNQNRWEDRPATVSAGNGKSRRGGSIIDVLDRELEKIEREEKAAGAMPEDVVLSLPRRSVL
jgi:hypothetical protein